MLNAHIAGQSYREIGAAHGISAQAAHQIVQRTGRAHVEEVLENVHDAMRDDPDAALVLLIPPGTSAERRLTLAYVAYVEAAMRRLGAEPDLSFHGALGGGMAVAIVDRAYRPERITA
jgi:hypothetical protein